MSVTASTFRTNFPEFANTTTFPDAMVNFWLGLAAKMHDPDRWGDSLDYGVCLFVAHNVALQSKNAKAAASGSVGGSSGVLASKSVDKVSVSYDTGSATVAGGGAWNLTTYGVQWLQLAKLFGSGGMQL